MTLLDLWIKFNPFQISDCGVSFIRGDSIVNVGVYYSLLILFDASRYLVMMPYPSLLDRELTDSFA